MTRSLFHVTNVLFVIIVVGCSVSTTPETSLPWESPNNDETPTDTFTPTSTYTNTTFFDVTTQKTICHFGASIVYHKIIEIDALEIVNILGKNGNNGDWVLVRWKDNDCWIESKYLQHFLEYQGSLPVVPTPLSPTSIPPTKVPKATKPSSPTKTSTDTPTKPDIPTDTSTPTKPDIPTDTPTATDTPCYPPPAPKFFEPLRNGNSFTLSWSAVSGATKYRLHISGKGVVDVNGTSATVEVRPHESFEFYVTAINVCGEGPSSNSVTISR